MYLQEAKQCKCRDCVGCCGLELVLRSKHTPTISIDAFGLNFHFFCFGADIKRVRLPQWGPSVSTGRLLEWRCKQSAVVGNRFSFVRLKARVDELLWKLFNSHLWGTPGGGWPEVSSEVSQHRRLARCFYSLRPAKVFFSMWIRHEAVEYS